MGRKSKYSKELKKDTSMRYLNGERSYLSLAKELSTSKIVIRNWIL